MTIHLPAHFRPKLGVGFQACVSLNDDSASAQGLAEGKELFKVAEGFYAELSW
jgi:hypothetical protein